MTLTEFHTEAVKISEEFPEFWFNDLYVDMAMDINKIPKYEAGAVIDEAYAYGRSYVSPTAALQLFRAELEKIRATNNIDQHKEDIIL